MHEDVTGPGEKGSTVRHEDDRSAARSGAHPRLDADASDLVADTVRVEAHASDLVADTVREDPDRGEPTAAIPTVQGYLEPRSRPLSEPTPGARALLRASEEVTRELRPRTLPPPRVSVREVFARDSAMGRGRQATGRQPAYVPGAVAHRDIARPRESYAPRPRESYAPRGWSAPDRPSVPDRPSAPDRPSVAPRPPPLREDNPITFLVQPATASKRHPTRTPIPWWVAMGVGLSLGVVVATGGFVAWMSAREPAAPATVTATAAPAAAPVSERARPPAPAPLQAQVAATPTERGAAAAFTWAPTERRTWQGATEGDDSRWSVVLSLRLGEDNTVRGYLAWSAVSVQGAREGEQVRENVDGTWDGPRGALTLRGTASTNPLLLPVNSYRLHASTTGALRGASLDDGVHVGASLVAPRRARHHDE